MRRTILIVLLLGVLCAYSLVINIPVIVTLDAPQDDLTARSEVSKRPELLLAKEECDDTIIGRLKLLRRERVKEIFGSKLNGIPSDKVLPLFIPVDYKLHSSDSYSYRDEFEDGTWSKDLTDFHSFGDIGFVEFFYNKGFASINGVVLYLRKGDTFVPLKSTNDLPKRIKWEKAKIASLNQWLDKRIPGTDLGVVGISQSNPVHFDWGVGQISQTNLNLVHLDLGGGNTGVMAARLSAAIDMSGTNILYNVTLYAESTNIDRNIIFVHSIDRTNKVAWFSGQGRFYRMIPKFVGSFIGPDN